MMEQIRQWIKPPIFPDDEDKTRNAQILYALLLNMLLFLLVATLATIFIFVQKLGSGLIIISLLVWVSVSRMLVNRGHVLIASRLFVVGAWVIFTLTILLTGRINTTFVSLQLAITVIAGVLIGRRSALTLALLSIVVGLGLTLLENTVYSLLPYFPVPPFSGWAVWVLAFILTLTPLNLAIHSSARSLARARQSEKRYMTLFEEAPMMYVTAFDTDGIPTISNCNVAFLKTLDYQRDQVIGQPLTNFYAHQSQSTLLGNNGFQRALRGEMKEIVERDLVAKDGHIIHTLLQVTPDVNETGQVLGILGMFLDITERKQAEEALRAAETLERKQHELEEVQQMAHIGSWSLDFQTLEVKWSEELYRIFGLDPAKKPPSWPDGHKPLYHPDDWDWSLKAIEEAFETGKPYLFENRFLHAPDGSIGYAIIFGKPCLSSDGEITGYVGAVQDITERKRAEEALRVSEERYRLITQNAEDIIWTTNMQLQLTYVSPSMERTLGYTAAELKALSPKQFLKPESLATGLTAFAEEVEQAQPNPDPDYTRILELEYCRKDSSTLWVEMKFSFFRNTMGHPIGLLGVGRDITERKQAENALKRRADEFAVLYEIASEIAGENDLPELLNAITARVATLFDVTGGGMYLYDEKRNELKVVSSTHPIVPVGTILQMGEGMAGRVAQSRQPMIVNNYKEWEYGASQYGTIPFTAVIEAPMLYRGALIGVLAASEIGNKARQFTEEDVRLLSLLASGVAGVIQNARDITERKRMEVVLSESETKFRAIFENSIDAIGVSKKAKNVFVNPAYVALFGYDNSDELIGKPILELIAPDSREQIIQNVRRRAIGESAPSFYETRGLRKNGTQFDLEVHVSTFELQDEMFTLVIERDITDRKQAEDKLLEKETQLRALNDNIPNGYTYQLDSGVHDEMRKFIYISAGVEKIFNIPSQQILDDPTCLSERFLEEDNDKVTEIETSALAAMTTFKAESRFKRESDQIGWMLLTSTPRKLENNHTIWDGIALDITEQKRAENALQKNQVLLRETGKMAKVGGWEIDLASQTLTWTEEVYCIHEVEADFHPTVATAIDFYAPESKPTIEQAVEAAIVHGKSFDVELQIITAKGNRRWVHAFGEVKNGKVFGAFQDVTKRKQTEEREHEQRALAEALSNSAAALNSTLKFHDVLDHVLDNVGRVVPHDASNIMLLDTDGDTLSIACHRGYVEHGAKNNEIERQFSLGTIPILIEAARTGQSLAIPDTQADPTWTPYQATKWVRSYLTVPIQIHQNTVGFLNLDSKTVDFFNIDHAKRLKAFANHAAIAINNAQLYEDVRILAVTDTLTGIYNRTFFETELARIELGRDFPVSIIVSDLDNLKTTNDTLGHIAGDELIKNVTTIFKDTFRAADIVARIGGDEFAVLLPNTSLVTAEQMLSRVRKKIVQHNAAHPQLSIQLSLGAATAEQDQLMETFTVADQRMYADKARRKSSR